MAARVQRAANGKFDAQFVQKLGGFVVDELGAAIGMEAANHEREAVEQHGVEVPKKGRQKIAA